LEWKLSEAAAPIETTHPEVRVFLGLGSNIQAEQNLPRAVSLLKQLVQIDAISTAWHTPSVGAPGPDFLNAAVLIQTSLSSQDLKKHVIRKIEAQLGRKRTADKNAPRTIDIDILIFDNQVVEPEIWDRAFLAVPLSELAPGLCNPDSGESLQRAAERLSQKTRIKARPEILPGTQGGKHS
jgi:2-amino-4-hydroxy-6-hydroxymethyldihydropteridine diphosphokinase